MIKHIGYLDRDFGYGDRKEVSGDMGWSFCDMRESFTEDIKGLLANSREYCFGDEAVWGDDVMDEYNSFAIYSVCEADIELKSDDEPLYMGEIVEGTAKTIEIHVCATKEQAGWIEKDEYFKDKNVEFKYREL